MHVRLHLAGEGWPPKLVTYTLAGITSALKIEGTEIEGVPVLRCGLVKT